MDNSNRGSSVSQNHTGTGHNVAGDLTIYNIDNVDLATELAVAVLVGCWDEKNDGDIKVITSLIDEPYESWIKKLRIIEGMQDSPLIHERGSWRFKNRIQAFQTVSSRLFDDHLDLFQAIATSIFKTIDPQFELAPEERYAAVIYGKVLPHSQLIRKGLSEGLALVATKQELLTNCSKYKGQYCASSVVKEVFSTSSWQLWASTQDIQIMLAESAPDDFIDEVERAISHKDKPFDSLFAQEGVGGISGRNYLTGLLWAIEGLAWAPEYLSRSLVILGELDSHDPGGNWANRPLNSIINILLPWLPHTTASIDRRIAAFKALEREYPDTAWRVLVQLLPNNMSMTVGTHIPTFRKFIPNDFNKEPSSDEYREQIETYSQLTIELASKSSLRLIDLVEKIDKLSLFRFDDVIKLLSDFSKNPDSDELKLELWEKCLEVYNKHKKFSDAQWAIQPEQNEKIKDVSTALKPEEPMFYSKRLFGQRSYDLFDENEDWEAQEERLVKERCQSISEIHTINGIEGVLEFSKGIERPDLVGNSLVAENLEIPLDTLKKLLLSDIKEERFLASGYVWAKKHKEGRSWVLDAVDNWNVQEKVELFLLLPFKKETWDTLNDSFDDFPYEYWKNTVVNAYHCGSTEEIYFAVDCLIKVDRPVSAINCLSRILHNDKVVDSHKIAIALLQSIRTTEDVKRFDINSFSKLVNYLQNDDTFSDDDLVKIEWAYLPIINRDTNGSLQPQVLENKLANEPSFFCEIIRYAYRPNFQKEKNELSESEKNIANNSYYLLDKWSKVPGIGVEGKFDVNAFNNWFNSVQTECEESGHLEIAYQIIGRVLIFSPSNDQNWILPELVEFLNRRELEEVRTGYKIAIRDSRGVHWVDPEGKPELELAQKYRIKSDEIELLGFHRFARTLRELADEYQAEAESIIEQHSKKNGC
ncbi:MULTISPECIES: hypothetical protein [Proteus]|uniref:hypothetical protein n=1 Tax=Proteus TaxID=583 RepID=UPI000531F09D|nr:MULTISPECIES: hypothetical protein [Proteus]EIT1737997.1 hypothetical protein [Proteus mirabilis]EJG2210960.1 hypothetical protein [Proteus mirabilis]EKX4939298.1 hypothetical protein [Proteus mirabilis]EKX6257117.1 hypothetical protein [Proteus mirabilis]EKX6489644.1 hypothetical protein [Proteus mirabilis]